VAWHAAAIVGAAVMVGPFIWMLSSSLKNSAGIFAFPPTLIPHPAQPANFVQLVQTVPILRYTWNSFVIAGLSAVGQVCCCSLAGYAFARLTFRGKGILFWVLMTALMVPLQVTLIPTFLLARALGWVNSYYPIIVPWFLAGAIGTFLLRQFFATIPTELEDAAHIDGDSRWGIFLHLFVPLSMPAVATVAIFSFVTQWNNLLGPVIYLHDPVTFPLTLGLASLKSEYSVDWNLIMAGNLISVVPIVLLYACAQRYFVEGIVTSGLNQ